MRGIASFRARCVTSLSVCVCRKKISTVGRGDTRAVLPNYAGALFAILGDEKVWDQRLFFFIGDLGERKKLRVFANQLRTKTRGCLAERFFFVKRTAQEVH